jgi:Arc/MetJ-type ribon-helix-helix transcriptional regulator
LESKQFSFRLPENLVDRVESCVVQMRESGLEMSRTDVVRLLLKHALDATDCKLERLLHSPSGKPKRRRPRPKSHVR